jgi:hypothetical protein
VLDEWGWPYPSLLDTLVEWAYDTNCAEPIIVETPEQQMRCALGADGALEQRWSSLWAASVPPHRAQEATMATWIDGDYEVGTIGFRIDQSNPIRHTQRTTLAQRPAHTNRSHEPRLYGWCGSWNDTHTDANGIWRVVRRAANGRVQIAEVTNREEMRLFLEQVGYPALLTQGDMP